MLRSVRSWHVMHALLLALIATGLPVSHAEVEARGPDRAHDARVAVARRIQMEDMAPATRTVMATSAADRAALVGRYRLGPNWAVDIQERDGALVAGPAGRMLLLLFKSDRDTYLLPSMSGIDFRLVRRGPGRSNRTVMTNTCCT